MAICFHSRSLSREVDYSANDIKKSQFRNSSVEIRGHNEKRSKLMIEEEAGTKRDE